MPWTEQQVRAAAQEAEKFNKHLMTVQARLKAHRITEQRGPATVVIDGLGHLLELIIDGVDSEELDFAIAALRAADEKARNGYEAFVAGRGNI